jgi:ADP-ribose pyrophosphatase YjhB (NUDIX family)
LEEAGVAVTDVQFVAITNDVLEDVDKHYVTIWMRGEAAQSQTLIKDAAEIAEAGWFYPHELPKPLHAFFENLRLVAELAQVRPNSSLEQSRDT